MWLLPKNGGLLLCSKNYQCENNVCTNVVTLLSGNLSMPLTLSCLFNKSSFFSRITQYSEHAISKWYSSSTRFSFRTLPIFMFAWWCHDAMMLPQHLTCVSEFKEVLRLSESQGSWGSELQLDMFAHCFLTLGPILYWAIIYEDNAPNNLYNSNIYHG